ncbi:LuxR C-terminal-related transcriptional regulator [Leifsonia shinshuensis]|uniref:LuxR C-terminal-related transcriptional regulator n=1 Tax=Leifsonia shinshuensis TaxID=150026 RepID=UPI0028585D20|nr:LuxR C-terminal-related transcriptional regulator [Leifsonia shinshuensis]MDR6972053.1 LuxR family maltose regulon positive regulatory protein [Leifsonia shinshuensis]
MERAESTTETPAADPGERRLFEEAWSQLETALAEGGPDPASEVARRRWFDLIAGPVPKRAAPLRRLPAEELRDHPLLALLAGLDDPAAQAHRVGGLLRAGEASAVLGDPARRVRRIDRAIVLLDQAQVQLGLGRTQGAAAAARAAATELEHLSAADVRNVATVGGLHSRLGATLLYSGDPGKALTTVERGLAYAHPLDPAAGLGNVAMLALLHAGNGDGVEARRHILTARSHAVELRRDNVVLLNVADAIVALDALDPVTARARLRDADPDLRTTPHWLPFVATMATAELASGHPGRGLAHLEESVGRRGAEARSLAARGALSAVRAQLELALGHPASAAALLERDAPPPVDAALGTARVELALDRHGAALQQLRSISGALLSTRQRAEAAALEAAVLLRFANEERVGRAVDHLGAILEGSGNLLALSLLPAADLERVGRQLTAHGYGEGLAVNRLRPLIPDVNPDIILTARETAVLAALLDHPSHSAIAAHLNVSINTVKSQLRSAYRKLGVSNRDEAIAVALDRHVLVERE